MPKQPDSDSLTSENERDAARHFRELPQASSDITQRKQAGPDLQLDENRYRTLFNSIEQGFCIVRVLFDEQGRAHDFLYEECNESFTRQTGFEDPVGRRQSELLPTTEPERFEIYGQVALTGQAALLTSFVPGLRRWYDIHAYRLGSPEQRRVAILFNDITERKQFDDALRESEARFRNMTDNAPFMVWVTEADGSCTFLSKSWYEFTGQTAETGLGFGWLDAVHAEDRAGSAAEFERANRMQEPFRLEYRLRRKDGVYRWAIDAATPRFDGEGRFLGYTGSVLDIADRREVEEKLRENERRLRTIIEQLPAGVGVMDNSGEWIISNEVMEHLVPRAIPSITAEGTRHWHSWDSLGEPVPPQLWPGRRALNGEKVIPGMEMLYRDGKSQDLWLRVSAAPLYDNAAEVNGACVVTQDITQVKNSEQAFREADRRKDQFLATLAHELRNPLAPIRNGLNILRLSAGGSDVVTPVHDMLERQVDHMIRLVDDLMEVSRISGGHVELRKVPTELAMVIYNAVETSRPLIDAAHHQLTINLAAEPLIVDIDQVRFTQVIANLLNNAAKYTNDGGHIWLQIRRDGDDAVISVKDNGIGIPENMLLQVFDLFTQVDRTYNRTQGGLGIGLTLVRSLVQLHGGSVVVKSEGIGKGSEFLVKIPLVTSGNGVLDPERGADKAPAQIPLRILVVDDNRDAADSLGTLLGLLGADVRIAHDGHKALAEFASWSPEVIVLDIGMPGMDGHELARHIRDAPNGARVILIALTGWGQEEDRRHSKAAGIDHHLIKPLDFETLETLLMSIASATDR